MAEEYCSYYPLEPYCQIIAECSRKNLSPKQCRPERCPFEDESYPASGKNSSEAMGAKEKKISSTRGCRVVSTCMQTDVIDQYKKALAKNK